MWFAASVGAQIKLPFLVVQNTHLVKMHNCIFVQALVYIFLHTFYGCKYLVAVNFQKLFHTDIADFDSVPRFFIGNLTNFPDWIMPA